jgi:uncharacterized SAM-binding protein YcdF (DUF218 family)
MTRHKPKLDFHKNLVSKRNRRIKQILSWGLLFWIVLSLLINLFIRLPANSKKPVDAILVLGGSIRREIHAAQLAAEYPQIPILISQGSKEPCIKLLFERSSVRLSNVWVEKCAQSTFDNYFYSVPILRRWGVHRVRVVTSGSHARRAQYLAQIQLGSQGLAVEMDIVKEQGIPGNRESALKTALDVSRSLLWAIASQVIYPYCGDFSELTQVDLEEWQEKGFGCERQGGLL